MLNNSLKNEPIKSIDYFESAQEAWFWYCICQTSRHNGRKSYPEYMHLKNRPCSIDDVYKIVLKLNLANKISKNQIHIMITYGQTGESPQHRIPSQKNDAILWDKAMDELTLEFNKKNLLIKNIFYL